MSANCVLCSGKGGSDCFKFGFEGELCVNVAFDSGFCVNVGFVQISFGLDCDMCVLVELCIRFVCGCWSLSVNVVHCDWS